MAGTRWKLGQGSAEFWDFLSNFAYVFDLFHFSAPENTPILVYLPPRLHEMVVY